MKLSKTLRTRLKNKMKKGKLVSEVQENGLVFYYEDEGHKAKIEKRKQKRKEKRRKLNSNKKKKQEV